MASGLGCAHAVTILRALLTLHHNTHTAYIPWLHALCITHTLMCRPRYIQYIRYARSIRYIPLTLTRTAINTHPTHGTYMLYAHAAHAPATLHTLHTPRMLHSMRQSFCDCNARACFGDERSARCDVPATYTPHTQYLPYPIDSTYIAYAAHPIYIICNASARAVRARAAAEFIPRFAMHQRICVCNVRHEGRSAYGDAAAIAHMIAMAVAAQLAMRQRSRACAPRRSQRNLQCMSDHVRDRHDGRNATCDASATARMTATTAAAQLAMHQ